MKNFAELDAKICSCTDALLPNWTAPTASVPSCCAAVPVVFPQTLWKSRKSSKS